MEVGMGGRDGGRDGERERSSCFISHTALVDYGELRYLEMEVEMEVGMEVEVEGRSWRRVH